LKTINVKQGTPEWLAIRSKCFTASEASAMLGLSPYMTRNELLKQKATGIAPNVDAGKQYLFDKGHAAEAAARALMEQQLGEDLYPVVVTDDAGIMLASVDGLTMDGTIAWEHKLWNADLANAVLAHKLPDAYQPQCQQILLITGAKQVIFTVSDGMQTSKSMNVLPDHEWQERIIDGWAQFEKDLKTYKPHAEESAAVAAPVMQLPTLAIAIRGEVTSSNLAVFRDAAETFISRINRDLKTDQDFADAEQAVKTCKEAEEHLEFTRKTALAQTASVDELMRTIDHIKNQLSVVRLALDKDVKRRKEEIRTEIVSAAEKAYRAHIAGIQAEIAPITIPFGGPNFAVAIKNKRTLESLHNAVDSALAEGKIAADGWARDVRQKLSWFNSEQSRDYGFLFRDLQSLIVKPDDDFRLAVFSRVEAHKRAEAEKIEAAAKELERKRIAEAQAENERLARLAEQQKQAIEREEAAKEAQIAAPVPVHAPVAETAPEAAIAPRQWQPVLESSATAKRVVPTLGQMIDVIANHYKVSPELARTWLLFATNQKAA